MEKSTNGKGRWRSQRHPRGLGRLVRPPRRTVEINTVKTIRWLSLLALLGTAAVSADVYRSTDAKGNVVYSDRPSENSEPIVVIPPKAGRPGNPISPPKTAAQANATNGQSG